MKKISTSDPYWIWKFGAICFALSLAGTLVLAIFEAIFGIVAVWYTCVGATALAGLILMCAQLKDYLTKNKKR